jgi:hypothetical protein
VNGGTVWFSGADALIFSYFGLNCSIDADAGGFGTNCWLQVQSSASGTIRMNESVASMGRGSFGTFRIGFLTQPIGLASVTSSINSSENEANKGTGILFAECYSRVIRFCHFDSNAPTSVFFLGPTLVTTDEFLCLNFVNNSCTDSDIHQKCLISLSSDCGFRDCLFFGNTMTYLAGLWESSQTIAFAHCIFDRDMSDSFYSVTFDLVSCDVRTDWAIVDERVICPSMTASAIPATAPPETASPRFTDLGYVHRRAHFLLFWVFLIPY